MAPKIRWGLIFVGLIEAPASCYPYYMIHLLTAIGLSPGGSTHLHTNNTDNNTNNNRTTQITTNVEEWGPCPVFASFTLAFALELRKKHGKTSVRVRKTSVRLRKTSVRVRHTYYQNTHTLSKHPHINQNTHTFMASWIFELATRFSKRFIHPCIRDLSNSALLRYSLTLG
jgi:hypothetical protein